MIFNGNCNNKNKSKKKHNRENEDSINRVAGCVRVLVGMPGTNTLQNVAKQEKKPIV
jgi:hypothetical protein